MGYGSPVAQNVQPPNVQQGVQTLSGLLGLQQQRQQLQLQQQDLQRSQVQTQQDLGVNQFFSNWDPGAHHGDDGTLDLDSAHQSDAYQQLPGVARIAVDAKLNALKGQQLQNKQQLSTLNGQVVGQFGQLAQALSTNKDPGEIQNQLTAFAKQGPDQARIAQIYGPMLQKVPPQNMGVALKTMAAQAQDVSAQQAQTNPAQVAVNTGGATQLYNVNKATGIQPGQQPAAAVPNTLPPQIFTPSSTAPSSVVGGGYGTRPVTVPSAPNAPPAGKLQPLQPPNPNDPAAYKNYQTQIQAAGEEYQGVSKAANDPFNGIQPTRFRNQQILDLSPHADTGPGLHMLNLLASRIPGESGDAYQVLEHYTAQNSAAMASTMGVPNTNLGQQTGAAAAGNVERNPKALQEIVKTNDALNTAFSLYNRGLAAVTNNGADMSRVPAFKQAFGQNLDVNALRWADANRRKDEDDIKAMRQKFGDAGIAELQQKLNTLKSLSTAGDLP